MARNLVVLVVPKIQIFLLLIFSLTAPSFADPNQPDSQLTKKRWDKRPAPLENYKNIASPQGFPDLPVFSGKTKFLGGFYSPEKNGISVCQMRYVAEEGPPEVINFYKDAFNSGGWKVLQAANNHLTARHKDGHLCSVNVNECRLPKSKSQFTVAYRQIIKQR